jgi:hypothetical protein
VGVKASPIRQAPGGAAMKVQVQSSPDGISLRTLDMPHWLRKAICCGRDRRLVLPKGSSPPSDCP